MRQIKSGSQQPLAAWQAARGCLQAIDKIESSGIVARGPSCRRSHWSAAAKPLLPPGNSATVRVAIDRSFAALATLAL